MYFDAASATTYMDLRTIVVCGSLLCCSWLRYRLVNAFSVSDETLGNTGGTRDLLPTVCSPSVDKGGYFSLQQWAVQRYSSLLVHIVISFEYRRKKASLASQREYSRS